MSTDIAEPTVQGSSTDHYEMLIKEARQLQQRQRRRRWTIALVLVAVIGSTLTVTANGGRNPSRGSTLKPSTSSRSTTGNRAGTSARGRLLQAEEIDVAGPSEVIVGNFQGVFLTNDGGRNWINITPSVITSQPFLLSHLVTILSTNDNHIWLELEGDARTTFTAYSSSGGTTWAVLKNSASSPLSRPNESRSLRNGHVPKGLHIRTVYVASPSLAWAQATGPVIGNFTPTYLLRTTSGGQTWTAVKILK
jgi:photosystem II stability/assembly factor-like uncharacterized protein